MNRHLLILFLVVCGLLFAVPVDAASYTWEGGTDDSLGTNTNWTPNGSPTISDEVHFGTTATATTLTLP